MTQLEHVVRSDLAVDGLTVYGYALPYNVEAVVNDGFGEYVEMFVRGSMRNVVRGFHRIRFNYLHDDDVLSWIGKTQLLREEDAGMYGEWRLDRTDRGRHVAYKIADGQLPGLSVSFVPGKTVTRSNERGIPVTVRETVKAVDHIAAVPNPSYMPPAPLMVRDRPAEVSSVERWREWRKSLTIGDK